jgi:hypothetical protein
VQQLGAGIEASEHVDEHVLVAGGVGVDDALGVGEVVGGGKLAEHVLAGIEAADDVFGVQPGGQAHVDEIDGRVVIDRVQFGRRGEPELGAYLRELRRGAAENDDLIDGGMAMVDAGVSDSEAGARGQP